MLGSLRTRSGAAAPTSGGRGGSALGARRAHAALAALLTAALAAACVPVPPRPGPPASGDPAGRVATGACPSTPEEAVARLVNRERAVRGLPPLVVDVRLAAAAAAHAADLARRGVSGHEGADGSGPAQRADAAGYAWRVIAENVAAGQPDATTAVAAWMRSPGHRANVLATDVRHVGAGYARDPGGRLGRHWVVVFGDAPAARPPADGCHP